MIPRDKFLPSPPPSPHIMSPGIIRKTDRDSAAAVCIEAVVYTGKRRNTLEVVYGRFINPFKPWIFFLLWHSEYCADKKKKKGRKEYGRNLIENEASLIIMGLMIIWFGIWFVSNLLEREFQNFCKIIIFGRDVSLEERIKFLYI